MKRDIAAAGDAIQETMLENPIQKTLNKPSPFGNKSLHLSVIDGPKKGDTYNVTAIASYTIGRAECDVILNEERVSRKHASITIVRVDKFTVTDLASRNGTFVNGVRITSQQLKHNDLIRIGDTTFRFTVFNGPVPVSR